MQKYIFLLNSFCYYYQKQGKTIRSFYKDLIISIYNIV